MGAPVYSPQRIALIRKLMGDGVALDHAAGIVGLSKDALRVWLGRHAKANGIPRDVKVYKRRTPAPPPQEGGRDASAAT